MATESKIEWTDATFNPWIGCTRVSPACDHCYAAVSTPARTLGVAWGTKQPRRRTSAANWKLPLRWNARPFYACCACGWRGDQPSIAGTALTDGLPSCPACDALNLAQARRRVFCASLADVFDKEVYPWWRADLFALIGETPNLDWLLLTKRIGNVPGMLRDVRTELQLRGHESMQWPWPNIWLGATICNQAEADRDIPKLLAVPAAVRFLSMEPLLGPVSFEGMFASTDIRDGTNMLEELDWVIVGGESGPHARPMHPDWVRSMRDQCAATGTAFLFKQWGEWAPYDRSTADGSLHVVPYSTDLPMQNFGKKLAGRRLDGVLHDGCPNG
jgi:protein gp37